MRTLILLLMIFFSLPLIVNSQTKKPIESYTKEEIQQLTYDDLLQLTFEDLLKLAEKMGVSVDDLLNMKISVSSQSLMTPRESPGIVSIVTDEEIKNSGVRDLIDILNLIPGFNFGYDIDGVIGLASRGNWGHEGKILILLDGMELNENFYSTYQFGDRIPVDQIKRIEIIRGPGSCIYGGYAELGVVNIITKEVKDFKGNQVSVSGGMMKNNALRKSISFLKNDQSGDFSYSFGLAGGESQRSSYNYTTFDSLTYDLSGDQGKTFNRYASLGLSYKNLKTRFVYDKYSTGAFEYSPNLKNTFGNFYSEIKYELKLNDNILLTPKFDFKQQNPWQIEDSQYVFNKRNIRTNAGLNANIDFSQHFSINSGVDLLNDFAKDITDDSASIFYNGKKNIQFYNISFYAQAYLKTRFFNLNAGGRFDHHQTFGNNVAPRLGITKVFNKLHLKILYSQAFRAPAIENINLNKEIKTEHTTVSEFEIGYQLNKRMFLTANIFDINIKNPIVYQSSDTSENYVNYPKTGSRGFEVEYRYMTSITNISVNYSFYSSTANQVTDYMVIEDKTYNQAFPKHKIALNSWFKINSKFTISPSAIYQGYKYGNFLEGYKKQDAELNLNLNLIIQNLFTQNLDLSFSCYNLLDTKIYYIQPYGAGFPAFPGYSREFSAKLMYHF